MAFDRKMRQFRWSRERLSTERLGNFSAGENGFRQKDEAISVERKMAFDREMRLFQWRVE